MIGPSAAFAHRCRGAGCRPGRAVDVAARGLWPTCLHRSFGVV